MKITKLLFLIVMTAFITACNSSSLEEATELAEGIPRKTVPYAILGTNAFVNDSRFGSIAQQFNEVKSTLGLNHVRVLFDWNEAVQSGPGSAPQYGFYDEILASLPAGVDALVILSGIPSWMGNSANWIDGNPRKTFVESWVRPTVNRYRNNGRIVAFEIWNEPNQTSNPENAILGLDQSAANYVELLALAHGVVKSLTNKTVVSAATTAINQNFPESLDYNRAMRDAGAASFLDVWGVHYYGKQFENVVRSSGVADFLNSIPAPIWVTETGEQGVNEQLPYAEQVWPFLIEKIPGIARIYQYQFTESTDPASTYGLRNLSGDMPVSDLYVNLRDRVR